MIPAQQPGVISRQPDSYSSATGRHLDSCMQRRNGSTIIAGPALRLPRALHTSQCPIGHVDSPRPATMAKYDANTVKMSYMAARPTSTL